MKKFTAIFLYLVLLFNLVGYRVFFMYANKVLDTQAETSFDNNQYDEAATVTLKVSLSLPYLTDQPTFERTDGKITFNGKVYRYIKRKIVNNEMILVCLADYSAASFSKSENDFFKSTTGLFDNNAVKKSNASNTVFFNLLTVYNSDAYIYNFSSYKNLKTSNVMPPYPKLSTPIKEPPVKPPDIVQLHLIRLKVSAFQTHK